MSKQPVGVGERVAERRKLNGLTQAQLAHRAHVSLSLVRKVEQGSAPASPAFTAAVATALRTTVAELYDQPSLRYGAERDHIAEVETAVMEGPASVTAYHPPDLDVLAPGWTRSLSCNDAAATTNLRHSCRQCWPSCTPPPP